jgi:hypothetical protein
MTKLGKIGCMSKRRQKLVEVMVVIGLLRIVVSLLRIDFGLLRINFGLLRIDFGLRRAGRAFSTVAHAVVVSGKGLSTET